MSTTPADGRPTFSKGAVCAWAKSIGIPDTTALEFMRQEGAVIIDDDMVPLKTIGRSNRMNEGSNGAAVSS